jgi:hypothetical protein
MCRPDRTLLAPQPGHNCGLQHGFSCIRQVIFLPYWINIVQDGFGGNFGLGRGNPAARATMKTLYDVLGALPSDDADGLRTAFRKAVKGAHPDIHPGDPDAALKFREILRANEILGDAVQRTAYDNLLELARLEQKSVRASDRRQDSQAHLWRDRGRDRACRSLGRDCRGIFAVHAHVSGIGRSGKQG